MTGGGGGVKINFGRAREVYLCEFESVDQTKKVKTQKKVFCTKIFTNSGCRHEILAIFHEFLSEDQKKGLFPKCFMKSAIRCESTKITKKQFLLANCSAVNTNLGVLGLNLHSSSPKPVNFFGAQSSLEGAQFSFGGAQAVIWGARPQNAPSRTILA